MLASYMSKEQVKLDFSCHDPFNRVKKYSHLFIFFFFSSKKISKQL